MHLVCPHCHNPIEIVTASGNEDVLCPSCGSTFRLDTESTASWRTLRGRTLGRFELIEPVGHGCVRHGLQGDVTRSLTGSSPSRFPGPANSPPTKTWTVSFGRLAIAAQLRHPAIVPVHEIGEPMACRSSSAISSKVSPSRTG